MRVRASIATLGYRPDHRAQLLRRRGTASATIGFVPLDVSNPFFSAIYRGLEDVAWAHGYVVVAGSSDGTLERGEAILKRHTENVLFGRATPADTATAFIKELQKEVDSAK